MRKITSILLLICLLASIASGSILRNPGFEEGEMGQFGSVTIPNWTIYGTDGWHHGDTVNGVQAFIGTKAIKEWSDSTGIFQDFPVVVGRAYDFSIHAISCTGDNGGLHGWDAVLKVEWLDSDYVLILAQEIGRYYGIKNSGSSGVPGDTLDTWKIIAGTKTAPNPAVFGRVVLYVTDGDNNYTPKSGSINWDEACVNIARAATDPIPVNYADNLAPLAITSLSWERPAPRIAGNTVLCDVWFGTDPNIPDQSTRILNRQDANSVSVGSLQSNRDYYWRVDCYDWDGVTEIKTEGFVWTFNTANIAPSVDAGVKQKAWLQSGSASIALNASASDDGQPDPPGTLTYTWTSTGPASVTFSPSNQVEDPTAVFTTAGTYTLQLAVSDSLATVTDTVTATVYSQSYTGLIAHWKLDETAGTTAVDSVGGHNGVLIGSAAWSSQGQVNGAILLDGNGDYINCGGGTDANTLSWADLTDEISVSAWVKGTFDRSWQAVVNKGDSSWRLFRDSTDGDSDNVSFTCSNVGPAISGSTGPVGDDQWHHLVGTFDGVHLCIYVDGLMADSMDVTEEAKVAINDYNVFIGSDEQFPGMREFKGLIDEVRIYEIGLPADKVFDLFVAEGGHNSCGLTYLPGDVNGDCYVNISDFSAMAVHWLECNDIVSPECLPL